MSVKLMLPDLETQFLPPENWESNKFSNPETNHQIHYNFISPPDENSRGIVVILPGLSEFGEKYIETARFLSKHAYGVYIIDWAYQGRSTRLKVNPHKRHSDGYEADLSDLDYFIKNIINTDTNLFMLAHSMGGNIGLRYLIKNTDSFKAASLSAPMLGIKDLEYVSGLTKFILSLLMIFQLKYIPGGRDWHASARLDAQKDVFSNDPVRRQLHNKWCLADPTLQVGNVTLKWVYESLKSIDILKNKNLLQKINIPVLMATPEQELLVNNKAIEKASKIISQAKLLNLENSKHEILVETDEVRDKFLHETLKIFNQ